MILRRQLGFTIMELLVVLAIIGILAAVVYGGFGDARVQARNKAFMSDMKQVQLALELYKAQNNTYPATSLASLESALVPAFVPRIPDVDDSANPNCELSYDTLSANSSYKFTALYCYSAPAAAQGIKTTDEFARCPSSCGAVCAGAALDTTSVDFYETMAIYSLGSECE